MSDFAVWLKNLDPGSNTNLGALKDFAQSNAQAWPFGSNEIGDYISVVNKSADDESTRSSHISALADAFVQWKLVNQTPAPGFWSRLLTGIGVRLGPYLLGLSGLLIAAVMIYGIFYDAKFLGSMAEPKQARGLITFLFSISTIAIFLLIALATFWIEKDQVEVRYGKAKDLLTVMIGIFGTILGFYYGSPQDKKGEEPPAANVGAADGIVGPGETAATARWAAGGLPLAKCELIVIGPAGQRTAVLVTKPKSRQSALPLRE